MKTEINDLRGILVDARNCELQILGSEKYSTESYMISFGSGENKEYGARIKVYKGLECLGDFLFYNGITLEENKAKLYQMREFFNEIQEG